MRTLIYIIILVILLSFFIAFMVYQAHHDIINYLTIYDEKLPTAFNDFRVFFIFDIHLLHVNEITLIVIKMDINLFYMWWSKQEKGVVHEKKESEFEKVKKMDLSILFLLGYNDYEEDPEALYHLLVREGITILANTNLDISIKNHVLS